MRAGEKNISSFSSITTGNFFFLTHPITAFMQGAGASRICIRVRGREHPWMRRQLNAGPYLSMWGFSISLKGTSAVL